MKLLKLLALSIAIASSCAAAPVHLDAEQQATSEKTLNGFQDVKWGELASSAKKKISPKVGKFIPEVSDEEMLFYADGEVGGQATESVTFHFDNEGFFKAMVVFKSSEGKATEKYKEVNTLLEAKYGKPDEKKRVFQYPYEDGDGHETLALQTGKASIYSTWYFPSKEDKDTLFLVVDNSLEDTVKLQLIYENGLRQKHHTAKVKAKNSKDF